MVTAATADQHQLVLQAVWDLFQARDRWPTFDELDWHLDQRHELDVAEVIPAVPPGLLYGVHPHLTVTPTPGQTIGLTAAGAARCTGSSEDLQAFVGVIRYAAELHRSWRPGDPTSAEPVLTDAQVRQHVPLPAAGRDAMLSRLWELLQTEHWGWVGAQRGEQGWQFNLGRDVRQFRNVRNIDDYQARRAAWLSANSPKEDAPVAAETVFLVHGHDHGARHEVARVIQQLTGAEPVILDEQASRGRTLVEKFEQHATAARFAVVLLTADDIGGPRDGMRQQPRARQNVVFELGYFFGTLGRDHVVVLITAGVEKPSDVDGLGYIRYPDGDWKVELAREMTAAGLHADRTKL